MKNKNYVTGNDISNKNVFVFPYTTVHRWVSTHIFNSWIVSYFGIVGEKEEK